MLNKYIQQLNSLHIYWIHIIICQQKHMNKWKITLWHICTPLHMCQLAFHSLYQILHSIINLSFNFFLNVINISLKARESRKLNIEISINASINLTKWFFNWPITNKNCPYGGNISCMISTKYENTVQDLPNIIPTK